MEQRGTEDPSTRLGTLVASARIRIAQAGLVASIVLLALAPLAVADSYSVVEHTLSEAGGQGVEGAWVLRGGILATAVSVWLMTSGSTTAWGWVACQWMRIYAVAVAFLAILPEAAWDDRPHSPTVAFLHTVSGVFAAVAFIVAAMAITRRRPRHQTARRAYDWLTMAAIAVIPQLILILSGDGVLERVMVVFGYGWLFLETHRIAALDPGDSAPAVPRRRMSSRSWLLWTLSPPLLRGVGRSFFSLKVEWQGSWPEPPFVMAANHYSHFDAPLIAAVLDTRIRYLGLIDLFEADPVLAWLAEGFEAIPTPRHSAPIKAVRTALATLNGGEAVGVFPEGARASHWGVLQPKRGAAWLANRADVPLVPVAILGTGRAYGLDNDLEFSPIRIIGGKALPPAPVEELMSAWSTWISEQVRRYPELEVDGPRRASTDGL